MASMFMLNQMIYLLLKLQLIMSLDILADLLWLNLVFLTMMDVTFWYDRHEDNQRTEENIHAYDFIKRLIIHIYDKYFNVVRYYGLYAKKHKFSSKFNYMLKSHVAEFRKQPKNWCCRIELSFKHDPLLCSCGHTFHFDYLVQKSYNSS